MENSELMRTMSMQELQETNGGIAPILMALAWGFGIGFPSGVAIGIAKNV